MPSLQTESRAGAEVDERGSPWEVGQEGHQGQIQHGGLSGHQGATDGQGAASLQGPQDGEGGTRKIHFPSVRWAEVEPPQAPTMARGIPSVRSPQSADARGGEPGAGTSATAIGEAAETADATGSLRSFPGGSAAHEG